ncbi:hypothetical protein LCGC14_1877880 [marine sediment metagenome]|uniref:Calcineurin-like phosphoesterase domain-containing protein n=1 Tax=marine sediment metagenome TaxID=412755 RepID=A0A0F9J1N6_9ZZZZ
MGKIICCGDTHFKVESPFFEAGQSFMKWFVEQDFNNENNYLVHLGDVYHQSRPNPRVIKVVENWFLNKLKFKKMYILSGNHGYNRARNSYAGSPLTNFGNIELLKEPQTFNIESLKFLSLPYYYPFILKDIPPMEEYYSNLPEELRVKVDFIVSHVEDETSHFSDYYCDLSYLKGQRISGHIHIPSGHFLGSAFISRYDEKGKSGNLEIIDIETKNTKLIPIPRFLDYYDVNYPDSIPKVSAEFPIWNIHDISDKESVLEQYPDIYIHEMFKKQTRKKLKRKDISTSKKSIMEYFKEYIQLNKYIDDRLESRLIELIKK